jgi:hypothetical protein
MKLEFSPTEGAAISTPAVEVDEAAELDAVGEELELAEAAEPSSSDESDEVSAPHRWALFLVLLSRCTKDGSLQGQTSRPEE